METQEIPLSAANQQFTITLTGNSLRMSITWRAMFWCLDIMSVDGSPLVMGIPLITGADLLAQYRHLNMGFSLYVSCDDPANENPTETDLGTGSHLYAVTE
ncbi:hypothetical protein F9C28_17515 [Shimwellia pseudoproteus]|uniref:phage baseplate plug family protein n=1 Tax=Shimwellia pseudoproteus TaxID=570012 RepID=UPI0018EA614A|nr:hypothetical protein [Shimwellia pseudoproteus]MBJ3816660.1 hypothetical protein [Shimwellia pseudoproteus]